MTAFPKPCGRLDWHDEHEWIRGAHHEGGYGFSELVPTRTYRCIGRVLLEGGYYADWDAEDDAAGDSADRERREIA